VKKVSKDGSIKEVLEAGAAIVEQITCFCYAGFLGLIGKQFESTQFSQELARVSG